MDRVSTRAWIVIGIAGMLLFLSYWARFTYKRTGWAPPIPGFSYFMPRPQNFEPRFDLSDREVDRHHKAMESARKNGLPVVSGKIDTKKLKRSAVKGAPKGAAAKKAAQAARKPKTSVSVVDTSRKAGLRAYDNELTASPSGPTLAFGVAGRGLTQTAPAEETPQEKEEEDLKLSASQWRALLQTAPNGQNISKFIRAKQAGYLESSAYYQIIHELLADSAEDRRKAGLAILDHDVSSTTFEFIVGEMAQAPSDLQASLKTRLEAYSQPARLGHLVRVLSSSESVPALEAGLDRLEAALAEFKKTAVDMSQEIDGNREQPKANTTRGVAGTLTVHHFRAFVPALERLAQNAAGSVSGPAGELLTEIQNLSKPKS